MENLNAEQVKKALEHCANGGRCLDCQYDKGNSFTKEGCMASHMRDALALINSQEQRINELVEENAEVTANWQKLKESHESDCEECRAEFKRLTEENERLRGERAKFFEYKHGTLVRNALVLTKNKKEFDDFCKAIKADTVRKMHSMLCEGRVSNDNVVIVANQIAKEIIEETK